MFWTRLLMLFLLNHVMMYLEICPPFDGGDIMTIRKATLDVRISDYFEDLDRYADMINATVFEGRQVIDGSSLTRYRTRISTIISDEDTTNDSIEGYRDLMVESQHHGIYILIGLENQSCIDEMMPLRNMIYDVSEYNLQLREHQKLVRQNKKPGKLRLKPVFTPVIYYGDRKWKKKLSLKDVMDIPEGMDEKVNSWEIDVYDLKEIDVERSHNKDNRQLIDALQRIHRCKKEGMEILKGLVLTREIALIVACITDNEKLMKHIEIEEEEEVNMYESLRLLYAEADAAGEVKGMMKTVLTFLKRRVGGLSEGTEERIRSCTAERLNNFVEYMDEVKTESDIEKYLD